MFFMAIPSPLINYVACSLDGLTVQKKVWADAIRGAARVAFPFIVDERSSIEWKGEKKGRCYSSPLSPKPRTTFVRLALRPSDTRVHRKMTCGALGERPEGRMPKVKHVGNGSITVPERALLSAAPGHN